MGVGKVVNATIMDNNNGDKDGKDGKDGSKDNDNDEDDDDNEDDDNDEDDDDDDKNNNTDEDDNDDDKNDNATDGKECDDRNGEYNNLVSSGLEKRVYSTIETLRTKCEKANIECGFLGLVVRKKVTDKEPTEMSFLCCHNKYGQ